jgi:hypothetical protein
VCNLYSITTNQEAIRALFAGSIEFAAKLVDERPQFGSISFQACA